MCRKILQSQHTATAFYRYYDAIPPEHETKDPQNF